MWTCPNDGWLNQDDSPACEFCGAPRPTKGAPLSDDSSNEPPSGVSNDPNRVSQQTELLYSLSAVERTDSISASSISKEEGDEATNVSTRSDEVLVLTDMRTGNRLVVDLPFGVVGREGDFSPEVLNDTVSRQHLIVARRDGAWAVRHIGRTASIVYTQNQAIQIPSDMEYPLLGGENLRLGNMLFDVDVEVIEQKAQTVSDVPEAADSPMSNQVNGWFVDCPVCGHAIRVVDENALVRSCPCCVDPFDKRRVSRIKPVFGYRAEDMVAYAD